jgi:hypothetical protein
MSEADYSVKEWKRENEGDAGREEEDLSVQGQC